jgi:hypothetical protein
MSDPYGRDGSPFRVYSPFTRLLYTLFSVEGPYETAYGRGLPGLNDVMSGSNPGCNTDGFSAILGWDPVNPV